MKKYATNIKKKICYHLFTVETVFFNENFSIKKCCLRQKLCYQNKNYAFYASTFFGKTLECKLCFSYAGTITQGLLGTKFEKMCVMCDASDAMMETTHSRQQNPLTIKNDKTSKHVIIYYNRSASTGYGLQMDKQTDSTLYNDTFNI